MQIILNFGYLDLTNVRLFVNEYSSEANSLFFCLHVKKICSKHCNEKGTHFDKLIFKFCGFAHLVFMPQVQWLLNVVG